MGRGTILTSIHKQMDRTTIIFIVLCILLLAAQFFLQEGFFDAVSDVIGYCVDSSGTTLTCGTSGKCVTSYGNLVTCSSTAVIKACFDASGNKNTCGSSGQCVDSRDRIVYCSNTLGNGDWGFGSDDSGSGSGWGWNGWGMGTGTGDDGSGSGSGSYGGQFAPLSNSIRQAIRKEVAKSCSSSSGDDDCDNSSSPAAMQGAQFLEEVPGKNPDDYIRKDSIPCYGCSL